MSSLQVLQVISERNVDRLRRTKEIVSERGDVSAERHLK